MLSDYFKLALNNLKHRGVRSWLTMLGIFIGIAAVVALISLGTALESAVTGQFSDLAPDRLVVQNAETGFGPPGSTAVTKLNNHDVDLIESVSGVKIVVPRFIRVVEFKYNGFASFSYATSIPSDSKGIQAVYDSFNFELESGRLLSKTDSGKVVLGSDFATTEKYDKQIKSGSSVLIQDRKFEVVGILKPTGTFIINSAILMSESDMKDILNIGDEYDILAVIVDNKDKAKETALKIEDKLRKDRNEKLGEEDFTVQTPDQALGSINTLLAIINLIVVGIASISLFIGGIGIANTMFTSVLERTKEIGTMKAIGAQNKDILSLFLVESGLLGLVGGIVGAFIGLSLAYLVSLIAASALPGVDFQVAISYPLLFGSVAFSFVIGVVSGLVPSWQAANLNPVEALRQ